MPLTDVQREVFQVIRSLRSEESYVAGATVIHRAQDSTRFSDDVDLFHDAVEQVGRAAERDAEALRMAGFTVEFDARHVLGGSFARAMLGKGALNMKMEWAWDSAFRFFPLVSDEVLGFRLHDFDAATNKVLACAGRIKIRDFVDLIHLDESYIPLGRLIWASSGKDEGLTPEWIINTISRTARFRAEDLAKVSWAKPATPEELKHKWLAAVERAQQLIATFPPETLGAVFVDGSGEAVTSAKFDAATEAPHYGSVRGAWPRLIAEE